MNTLCTIEDYLLADAGDVPNNMLLPLLIYRKALTPPTSIDLADFIESTFAENGWHPAWRHVIYDYDHYHSNAHEVIGVYRGSAKVRFGHTQGIETWLETGDFVVIPAGVGHKELQQSGDFHAVGAYPTGQEPDIMLPDATQSAMAKNRIDAVSLPEGDPVFGEDGPLVDLW